MESKIYRRFNQFLFSATKHSEATQRKYSNLMQALSVCVFLFHKLGKNFNSLDFFDYNNNCKVFIRGIGFYFVQYPKKGVADRAPKSDKPNKPIIK
jgi:hypothetical protein